MHEFAFQPLTKAEEWYRLIAEGRLSENQHYYIFKHSPRCPVSSSAKRRLLTAKSQFPYKLYEVDVIRSRSLSQEISRETNVNHESPQLLFMNGRRCLAHCSHGQVDIEHAEKFAQEMAP